MRIEKKLRRAFRRSTPNVLPPHSENTAPAREQKKVPFFHVPVWEFVSTAATLAVCLCAAVGILYLLSLTPNPHLGTNPTTPTPPPTEPTSPTVTEPTPPPTAKPTTPTPPPTEPTNPTVTEPTPPPTTEPTPPPTTEPIQPVTPPWADLSAGYLSNPKGLQLFGYKEKFDSYLLGQGYDISECKENYIYVFEKESGNAIPISEGEVLCRFSNYECIYFVESDSPNTLIVSNWDGTHKEEYHFPEYESIVDISYSGGPNGMIAILVDYSTILFWNRQEHTYEEIFVHEGIWHIVLHAYYYDGEPISDEGRNIWVCPDNGENFFYYFMTGEIRIDDSL